MILTDNKIKQEIANGLIICEPYNQELVNPNSIDVTLAPILRCYMEPYWTDKKDVYPHSHWTRSMVLDIKKENKNESFEIPESGFILYPGILYLGATNEKVGSDHYIPIITGKSSLGRYGINIHATAGLGDLGFKNVWTLEISVIMPVIIYPNMPVGQIYFHEKSGECDMPYDKKQTSKYNGDNLAAPSKMYLNFKKIKNMKQRKIIEWLNLIEDSVIRTNAIENCTCGHLVAGDIKSALSRAFLWRSTPQGERYWVDVYESDIKLINENI